MISSSKTSCICIASSMVLAILDCNAADLPGQLPSGQLPLGIGGSVSWSSDYVLRGVSQSNNLPVVQADLHIRPATDWTLGAWASIVHVLPYTRSTELNLYLSRSWNVDQDWRVSVAGVHYQYLNDPRAASYEYDEISTTAYWADTLFGHIAWSPNTDLYHAPYSTYRNQQTLTVEGGFHYVLAHDIHFQSGIGWYCPLQQAFGTYVYGSAGLSRRFASVHVEINYFWAENKRQRPFNAGPAGGPWVLTAGWNF